MPLYNGDYPPSYKNQPEYIREKAVEIANALLKEGVEEGIAIATGLKRAREFFDEQEWFNLYLKLNISREEKRNISRKIRSGGQNIKNACRYQANARYAG